MKPTVDDFTHPTEMLIVVHDGPDNFDRSVFTAYWQSKNQWRGGSGIQGQMFVTDLTAFTAKQTRPVRILEETPA